MENWQFEFCSFEEQHKIIDAGELIGSSIVEGVKALLVLTNGNYFVEVFYEEDGDEINFMSLCPESRLHLYVEEVDFTALL